MLPGKTSFPDILVFLHKKTNLKRRSFGDLISVITTSLSLVPGMGFPKMIVGAAGFSCACGMENSYQTCPFSSRHIITGYNSFMFDFAISY